MTIGGARRVLSDIRKARIVITQVRGRHRIMSPIEPPLEVRGITEWQPELFNTTALIPRLSVKSEQVSHDWSTARILGFDWLSHRLAQCGRSSRNTFSKSPTSNPSRNVTRPKIGGHSCSTLIWCQASGIWMTMSRISRLLPTLTAYISGKHWNNSNITLYFLRL